MNIARIILIFATVYNISTRSIRSVGEEIAVQGDEDDDLETSSKKETSASNQKSADSTTQHIKRYMGRNYKFKYAKLIVNVGGLTQMVKSFDIASNNTWSCYDEGIGIVFDLKNAADEQEQAHAYLYQNSLFVAPDQKRTQTCRTIRR